MIEGYFALSGRIRRWRFFVYSLFLWILLFVLALLGIPLVSNARYPIAASFLVVGGIAAFSIWASMALAVKRLHDLDKSGWHYLWMFLLPGMLTSGFSIRVNGTVDGHWSVGYWTTMGLIPLLATLYLLFAPGSDGPNKYGYPP